MSTGFDDELLFDELNDILDIDMTDFGFDIDKIDLFKENERHKTNDAYNLDLIDFENSTNDFWQMPVIQNDNFIPDDIIGFNYAKSSKEHNVGIHFYLDDYQFERIWNKPEDYIDILKQYECIFSPDFSLYLDMPMPMKIWNIYRSRQIGQYYQSQGIKVIPTISWAEKETFEFAFKGIPKGSIVSISTIGVKRNKEALKIWQDGVNAMIEEIEPSTILVYGGKISQNLNAIRNAKRENLIIFDNNGNIIATETGNKQHVGYTEKDYKDRIVAHNHPNGVMPYPSEQDFKTAEKSGMKEMIVVSKYYTINYSIDNNYKGYGRQGIGYTIERNRNQLKQIRDNINNKTISDYKKGRYKSVEDYRNDTIKKQTEAVLREYKKYAKNSGYKLKITKR